MSSMKRAVEYRDALIEAGDTAYARAVVVETSGFDPGTNEAALNYGAEQALIVLAERDMRLREALNETMEALG